jgi:hypothetical protein
MTVGERGGSRTQGWSVDEGALSVMRQQNRAGTGSGSVTVHGAGIGLLKFTLRIGLSFSDSESSYWVSDSAVTCRSSHGEALQRML